MARPKEEEAELVGFHGVGCVCIQVVKEGISLSSTLLTTFGANCI